MKKRFLLQEGFTLIELVVATGVLVTIGALLSGIITSTLRGTNKTKVTTSITQNGNYAVSTITKVIQDSDAVVRYDAGSGSYTSQGACSITDPLAPVTLPAATSVLLHRIDGGITNLSCNPIASSDAVTSSPPIPLVDPSQVKVVSGSCSISCTQDNVYTPPTLSIQFQLTDQNTAKAFENNAATSFNTQVTLLNYHAQ